MQVIVFEDSHVGRLEPITLARPAYAICCGGMRLVDLLADGPAPVHGIVRPHLAAMQRAEFEQLAHRPVEQQQTLLVNARLVPSFQVGQTLDRMRRAGQNGIISTDGYLAAALLPPQIDFRIGPFSIDSPSTEPLSDLMNRSDVKSLPQLEGHLPLMNHPHDVLRHHEQILAENLGRRISLGTYHEIADGVFAVGDKPLPEYVKTDTSAGPIVLESGVRIKPFSYLSGPVYAAQGAVINEHSSVKHGVSLGQKTKIGGEVAASIIESYSNKQHFGYLGHSYVGSWVNIGAGTSNSDLKNTYGRIRVDAGDQKIDTGLQFFGCVIGDYSKTAINTSIFTGKAIGVCSMVYGFVTTDVPSFVNYARSFGQITDLPPDVMVRTQARMFQRRDIERKPWHAQLLHDLYKCAADGRQLADQPPAL